MPSLIDLRRRIRSVKNTQQITKAMKMVSAAKLRRAQERVLASRPYAGMLAQMLGDVAAAALASEEETPHPLLAKREVRRILLVLVTADSGLAGAFNANLTKAAVRFFEEHAGTSIRVEAIGRKGRDFLRRRGTTLSGEHIGVTKKPSYADTARIAASIIKAYTEEEADAVYVIYNEFKSVIAQKLTVARVLPVPIPEATAPLEYIYEQPPAELLGSLLPRYVEIEIYRSVLESAAAEHAARMTAMDAASSNAAEVIDKLTLFMNRVRQASITREIIEVVSGAAALE